MAARAKKARNKSPIVALPSPLDLPEGQNPHDPKPHELSPLQKHVAKLYGQGLSRSQIARALVDYLSPTTAGRPLEQRLAPARRKLRNWEAAEKFRNAVYDTAVVNVDMATPAILNGVVKKAKTGRVDAARLALEITGRHNPKGDGTPPSVVVAINGIPRPQTEIRAEVIDSEAEELEP